MMSVHAALGSGAALLELCDVRRISQTCQAHVCCQRRPSNRLNRQQATTSATVATQVQTAPSALREPPQVPQQLRKYVAQVQVADSAAPVQVYVLGVSHVSRQSCNQAVQLIEAVQPEVTLLELCKDRVDLLIDPSAAPPQHWHTRTIKFGGLPANQSSSTSKTCRQLIAALKCQPGRVVSAADIEQDCIQLLSSGIFGSVMPVTQPAAPADAPLFITSTDQIHTVAPLGSLQFRVTLRNLPKIQSLTLSASPDLHADTLQSVIQAAQTEAQHGVSTVAVLLEAHTKLQTAVKEQGQEHVHIAFSGFETGNVTADVRRMDSAEQASTTGLEESAKDGQGFAIQSFQARSPQVPCLYQSDAAAGSSPDERREEVQWRPWSQQEMQSALTSTSGRTDDGPSGSVNPFTNFVTQTYARYQREAGERVGVTGGQVWRSAFRAAARHGATQILLGDKPAVAMSQRMSQAIWNGTAPYLGAALLLALATFITSATQVLPSEVTPVTAAAAVGLMAKGLHSTMAPLLEIRSLSKFSAEQIEAAVALKEPIQNGSQDVVKLWGEDALLSWPGAMDTVIHERDAYMAKTILSAASGQAGSPAYIRHTQTGQPAWHYVMPDCPVESDLDACPTGFGSGIYGRTRETRSVVAVVGSAHVRGIVEKLQQLQAKS